MLKTGKKILCTLLIVVVCLTSAPLGGFVGIELPDLSVWFADNASAANELEATGQCGDDVFWNYDSGTGELIISGNGTMTDYYSSTGSPFYNSVIKSVIIKDGVTSIGRYVFYCCKELVSISIPDTVTTIRSDAFNGCIDLANVTIPKSVTLIGDRAFYNCESLTNIKISDKVTSICDFAFTGCKGLASITVDDNNEYYSNDKFGVLFNKDKTTLIQYPIGNSRISYTIPNSVTLVDSAAFYNCTVLRELKIPASTRIYNSPYTFYNCTNLETITLTKGSGIMCDYGSGNYNGLNPITSFDCTPWYISRNNLKNLVIEDGVKNIGSYAFCGCEKIQNITIPNTVTSIGMYSFQNCKNLISLMLPDSIITIEAAAFSYCDRLTSITIPDSVTTIREGVFSGCFSLKSITVDENNPEYSSDNRGALFNKDKTILINYPCGNTNATYIVPSGVTTIGGHAFSYCSSLKNVTIPDSVTLIDYRAFYYCDSLTSVIIPNNVISIGVAAFSCCANLDNITIPASVKSIGHYAFYDSNNLHDVYYYGSESQWNKISFGENVCLENAEIHFLGSDISHTPGVWEVILEATHDAEGKKIIRCITCGEILEEESIPKLVGKELVDSDTGVAIDLGTGVYDGEVDIIVNKSAEENAFNLVHTVTGAAKSTIYDINLTIDGVISQPKGYVTVKIPVPNGYNPNRCFIYYINTKNGTAEKIPTRYEDGYLVFETNHFSNYAVVEINNTDNFDCSCKCHKTNFLAKIIWKITVFFNKLFRKNKTCECGINHY